MNPQKLAFVLIKDFITDYNMYQWDLARRERRKPELLPSLVGVDETITKVEEADLKTLVRHTHLEVRAKYRIYYSRRSPGGGGAHRFELGRVREGTIIFDVYWSQEEGTDHSIEFPELKLKVET